MEDKLDMKLLARIARGTPRQVAKQRNVEADIVADHMAHCVGRGKCDEHDLLIGLPPYGWSVTGGGIDGYRPPMPKGRDEMTEAGQPRKGSLSDVEAVADARKLAQKRNAATMARKRERRR